MGGGKRAIGPRRQRHLLQHVRLLGRSGAGLQAIASPFCEAVRELIGAASGSIFWLDDAGEPIGFYHDSAMAEIKERFVSGFDENFFATERVNIAHFAAARGPGFGRMLDPVLQRDFLAGNIHRQLCAPLGHGLFLDMSAEVPGSGKAVFCGWYPAGKPLSRADAAVLATVQPLMEEALAAGGVGANWRSIAQGRPHLIASGDGGELLGIDHEAERILMSSQLLRQNLSLSLLPRTMPAFIGQLARRLTAKQDPVLHLPVPDGRLVCSASWTRLFDSMAQATRHLFVAFDLQVAEEVAKVRYVMDLDVTPLQRDIAAHAMLGGDRRDCSAAFGVSDEALKKHLRAIFAATQTTRWFELQDLATA